MKLGNIAPDNIELPQAAKQYPDAGNELLDRQAASSAYQDAGWCGYNSDSIVFRFQTQEPVHSISFSVLDDLNAWILSPGSGYILASVAGETVLTKSINETVRALPKAVQRGYFRWESLQWPEGVDDVLDWTVVLYPAVLPKGHPGAGNKAWMFIDELILAE